jgi:hypothetical protein
MAQVRGLRQDRSVFADDQLLNLLGDTPVTARSVTKVRAAGVGKQELTAEADKATTLATLCN